ncbi:Uma2 family endonuclease [Streptomyces sp. BRA346]|uniref:Uma2 family endonuclease n=1 Tax=Streptomyces sp. BRA346 TaxID=2878199 RepID=UPI00406444D9
MTAMIEHPATVTTDEGPEAFERLCRDLERASAALPDGYRAEIIGGKIVMSPWSQGVYNDVLDSLLDQLTPHVPAGHRARTTPNLYLFPESARAYGPDLHVADRAATRVRSIHLPGSALTLAAEQTSVSTREVDWGEKVEVYGKAEVPVYVLLDMQEGTVTVFHDPTPDLGYRQRSQIKFGEEIRIPAPFGFTLRTDDWES